MRRTARIGPLTLAYFLIGAAVASAGDELPQMKFNEVKEVAPGVFFWPGGRRACT